MNNDPYSSENGPDPAVEEESAPSEETPHADTCSSQGAEAAKKIDDFAKSVENAFKSGAKDAKKAFEEGLPKAKEDLNKGVHDIAYALAYATAFGGALLKEVTPDILSEGFREGRDAGYRAAEEVIRDRKERAERKSQESTEESGDSADSGPILV